MGRHNRKRRAFVFFNGILLATCSGQPAGWVITEKNYLALGRLYNRYYVLCQWAKSVCITTRVPLEMRHTNLHGRRGIIWDLRQIVDEHVGIGFWNVDSMVSLDRSARLIPHVGGENKPRAAEEQIGRSNQRLSQKSARTNKESVGSERLEVCKGLW